MLSLPIALVAILGPAPARAQEDDGSGSVPTLTEDQAVRRALARPALEDVTTGAVGVARSEAVREGLWPNPEVTYNREQLFGDQGYAQDFVMLTQQLDLSGRRGLRSDAAEQRARATEHAGEARRLEVVAATRLAFYELLAAQLRVEALGTWVRRVEEALAAVARRESAGDASAYDRRRLERELAGARARLAVCEAEAERAWGRLSALIVGPGDHPAGDPPRLSGTLLPAAPAAGAPLAPRIERRPRLLALDSAILGADLDARAAGRWWVPRLTLGGGWTGFSLPGGRADGYVVMATLSVPIFDRNQDEVLRAASEARLLRGRRELLLAEAGGEARGLSAALGRLVEAAGRFRAGALDGSDALVRTAEAGYAGGEIGILELLDAYRGAADDALALIDLELRARRARIRLDRITAGGT